MKVEAKAKVKSVKREKNLKKVKPEKIRVLFIGAKEFPFGGAASSANSSASAKHTQDAFPTGGIEAYADSLARGLAKLPGIEVTVVTRRFAGQKEREKIAGVNVVRVPWIRGFLLRNPSYNIAAVSQARKLVFDVAHAHGPIAALLAERLGKPVVATTHGVASGQLQYNAVVRHALRRVERRAYSRADAVVFLSAEERNSFREKLGFVPRRSVVIPSGIDLKKYAPARSRAKRAKRALRVVFVGRLLPVKGVNFLLEAASALPETDFLIVGDGPERSRLEARAPANVRFLGSRTPNEVARLLSQNEIFVLPSLSEGLPLALLEAMASGCACVVTDIGLPVRNGVEALVVAPGNVAALERALKKLTRDKKLRSRLQRNAAIAARAYSLENSAAKHAALYRSIVHSVQ